MQSISTLRKKLRKVLPRLDERHQRLVAAAEAKSMGHGGTRAVARATGMSEGRIRRGVAELAQRTDPMPGRVRKPGGGRKRETAKQPGLLDALRELTEGATRGDPEAPLRYVSRSWQNLSDALARMGFKAGPKLVGRLLKDLGFSLQGNAKNKEGANHPDRDAQFEHINALVKERLADGQPVVSVDTKKKELIGDFKNGGRELRPAGEPEQVKVHDFIDKEKGKVNPYGVFDIARNHGWVSLGISADTAEFAVEALRRWWRHAGEANYPEPRSLLITADCGGSNGYRVRLWKWELQSLADELNIPLTVAHLPPGTSKWNSIEHKLFAFISMNWRGKPLRDHATIIRLISATKTKAGLAVDCRIDDRAYETGITISDEDFRSINIVPDAKFHPEWNYTIYPRRWNVAAGPKRDSPKPES
jgi:hypothetical protein